MSSAVMDGTAETAESPLARYRYYRPWVPLLTWMTATYLILEVSFNARLLDIAGGLATPAEIEQIEKFGRFISGLAVALAILGMYLFPKAYKKQWSLKKLLVTSVVASSLAITGTFYAEKAFIDWMVERSGAEQRHTAALLSLLSHGVRHDHVDIEGIDLTPEQAATPEGKSFIALFAFLAFSTDNLSEKIDEGSTALLRNNIIKTIGSSDHLYNEAYVPSVEELVNSYNHYAEGANQKHEALAEARRKAESAWADYVRGMKNKGYHSPSSVPRRGHDRVRSEVTRETGVYFGPDWAIDDRRGFIARIVNHASQRADRTFNTEVESHFGYGIRLPDSLTWEQFHRYPVIRDRWVQALGITNLEEAGVNLRPDLDADGFRKDVWQPLVDHHVARERAKYRAETVTYADGGENETIGKQSMRAMIVPPIALAISLLGGIFHFVKLTNLMLFQTGSLLKRDLVRLPLAFALGAGLIIFPLFHENSVTQSRLYGYFEEQTATNVHEGVSTAMRWIVQMQPYAYPVNEFTRRLVLFGYDFGYGDGLTR